MPRCDDVDLDARCMRGGRVEMVADLAGVWEKGGCIEKRVGILVIGQPQAKEPGKGNALSSDKWTFYCFVRTM
jgi:hypothetical protein